MYFYSTGIAKWVGEDEELYIKNRETSEMVELGRGTSNTFFFSEGEENVQGE